DAGSARADGRRDAGVRLRLDEPDRARVRRAFRRHRYRRDLLAPPRHRFPGVAADCDAPPPRRSAEAAGAGLMASPRSIEEQVADETAKPDQTTNEFNAAGTARLAGAHAAHDLYGGFLGPLLPAVQEKLGLS